MNVVCYEVGPDENMHFVKEKIRSEIMKHTFNPRISWSTQTVTRFEGGKIKNVYLVRGIWK